MSGPPIQYSGPPIDPSVHAPVTQHLQLLYQKLGNHTQAFSLLAQKIAAIQAGSTTTIIEGGGGGSGGGGSTTNFLGLGYVNDQTGETSYVTTMGDNGVLLILDDASPIAVSLVTTGAPYFLFITNSGAGTATLTPTTGTVNGGASLTLLANQTVIVACDGTNWDTTAAQVEPQNTPAVAGEFLTAYNASTGAFSQATPGGLSVTIVTAQLTSLGTQGSQTFVNGILTAQTP